MKKHKKYKFEFYFYNKYAKNYDNYFKNKARLPIWREKFPNDNMTAEFLEYKIIDNKIIGYMNILTVNNKKDLLEYEERKYLMNHPEEIVGHLMLIGNE